MAAKRCAGFVLMAPFLKDRKFIRTDKAPPDIAARLAELRLSIRQAESRYGRLPNSVSLLAVSKARPAEDIALAYHHGQRAFAESYAQEALRKMKKLADLAIEWHFIGPLQSNKTRHVASSFSWVHSVERQIIASRLSRQRPADLPPLNVCVQLKLSDKETQSGASADELDELLDSIHRLPRLRLRGIMAIAPFLCNFDRQRAAFASVRSAYDRCRASHSLDTLSMGMSDDFVAAVAERATVIRLGRALFGERR